MADLRVRRADVDGMSDADLCWAVVEPLWPTADVGPEDELSYVAQGTPGQRAVYATTLYAREVDNGGVKQFLGNSSGLYSNYVLDGLELIGATELHDAFRRVMSYFPKGAVPIDRVHRQAALKGLSAEQWAKIREHETEVYSEGGFEGCLTPYWIRYIAAHESEFFL